MTAQTLQPGRDGQQSDQPSRGAAVTCRGSTIGVEERACCRRLDTSPVSLDTLSPGVRRRLGRRNDLRGLVLLPRTESTGTDKCKERATLIYEGTAPSTLLESLDPTIASKSHRPGGLPEPYLCAQLE